MAKTENTEMLEFTVVDAEAGDEYINVDGYNRDERTGGSLRLYCAKYEPATRKFVPDAVRKAESEAKLAELFGVTWDEVAASPDSLLRKTFKAYHDGKGRLSLRPIQEFVRYDKVDGRIVAMAENDMLRDIDSLPVGENCRHGVSSRTGATYAMGEFQIGFRYVVDGEEHNYRVDRLRIMDPSYDNGYVDVRTKYISAATVDKYARCDSGVYADEELAAFNLDLADGQVANERDAKVREFKSASGYDVSEMVENAERFHFVKIKHGAWPTGQDYLIGVIERKPADDSDVPF